MSKKSNFDALVIDNGSNTLKAGFAGDEEPVAVFPTIVGTSKGKNFEIKDSILDYDTQGTSKLCSPIERGMITDWDSMEKIWHHTFNNKLKVSPKDYAVLMTEVLFNPNPNREKMAELLFETFSFPAMYATSQEVLSAIFYGSGVVVSSGHDITNIVPIFQSQVLKHAVFKLNVAGNSLTEYLMKTLVQKGYSFNTIADKELVRDMKEKYCYVSLNFQDEINVQKYYQLPDGNVVDLGDELFKCPEALFQPSLIGVTSPGIDDLIFKSLGKCDPDIRSELYESIILCGGNTMFEGITDRIYRKFGEVGHKPARIRVVTSPDRKYFAWIGGSILGSLDKKTWITKEEYEETGKSIIHTK